VSLLLFLFIVWGKGESLGIWAIIGPFYQPQMVDVEIVYLVQWELTEETEVLG
jgi:hypothetical protein